MRAHSLTNEVVPSGLAEIYMSKAGKIKHSDPNPKLGNSTGVCSVCV